jgi:hypothetical protein
MQHLRICHLNLSIPEQQALFQPTAKVPVELNVLTWCGFCVEHQTYAGKKVDTRHAHMRQHLVEGEVCIKDWVQESPQQPNSPKKLSYQSSNDSEESEDSNSSDGSDSDSDNDWHSKP